MDPKIFILIVNWNTWKDTIECLKSVYRTNTGNYQAVVIDNGSTNDSVERIRTWAEGRRTPAGSLTVVVYDRTTAERGGAAGETEASAPADPRRLILIESGGNLGFAGGNNIGIRYALKRHADYVLLLNNDAFFRSPETLPVLVDFMERTASAGACGGTMSFPDGSPQQSYGNFPTPLRMLAALFPVYRLLPRAWLPGTNRSCVVPDGTQRDPVRIDWPSGACLMVRRQVIEQIGMLDDKYFLYLEETDWCIRMRMKGWDRFYVPRAEIGHAFGGSVSKTSVAMRRYHLESQFVYLNKHFSRMARATLGAGYILRASGALLARGIVQTVLPKLRQALSDQNEYWRAAGKYGIATLTGALSGREGPSADVVRTTGQKATSHP